MIKKTYFIPTNRRVWDDGKKPARAAQRAARNLIRLLQYYASKHFPDEFVIVGRGGNIGGTTLNTALSRELRIDLGIINSNLEIFGGNFPIYEHDLDAAEIEHAVALYEEFFREHYS